jgi:CRISPR system Cascade subunit CasA
MTEELRYRLLDEPLISIADATGRRREMLSLPALYAAFVRGAVDDFPALRPHQRHVWHAFLVQVGALALHRVGLTDLPDSADAWRTLLLALTPDDPDGAAWALVAPAARPALLQPPVPGADVSAFKPVETPDALDMLVTAKNHDVKRSVMAAVRPEHWVYALVSLQTQEGFLGAGNYGVSRMNGGFASRPGFGIGPEGGPGARIVRDVRRLLTTRTRMLDEYAHYPGRGGIGLVWLVSWDGKVSLAPNRLDPFYVEVCRRVRLADGLGRLQALVAGSAAARVDAKVLSGRTGDPWTPLMPDGDGRKAFTADAGGFSYKRLVPLLFPSPTDPKAPTRAPLQEWAPDDPDEGLSVVARVVVRGQGKTEGVHERRVPVSKTLRRFLSPEVATDEAARVASARVEDAGQFARRVLFPAVLAVYTAAPSAGERARDDDAAKGRANAALARFDAAVDATFFSDLEAELMLPGNSVAQNAVRGTWLARLRDIGRDVLDSVLHSAPSAAMRHYRTRVRARGRFDAAFRRHFGHRVPDADGPAAIPGSV